MGSSLRQRSFHERFRKCLRISLTFLFSQVGLMALVVAYSAAGAVLFEWLEADQEIQPRRHILQIRLDCLTELRRINPTIGRHSTNHDGINSLTLTLTPPPTTTTTNATTTTTTTLADDNDSSFNETEWSMAALALLKAFEKKVVKATKEEGYDGKEVDDVERQWSVSGALLYSITVITTIGYGNLAPKTAAGKVVTILYALIGIPLMLLCLSNLGSLMASSFQFAFGKIYCCFWCSSRCCCDRRRRRLPSSRHSLTSAHFIRHDGRVVNPHHRGPVAIAVDSISPSSKPIHIHSSQQQQQQQQHVELPIVKATSDKKRQSGVSFDDLVELTEKDYDIIQHDNAILQWVTDKCRVGQQPQQPQQHQQQQQQQHYGMDRLNQSARSVLDDCSRYVDDNDNPTNNNNNSNNIYHSSTSSVVPVSTLMLSSLSLPLTDGQSDQQETKQLGQVSISCNSKESVCPSIINDVTPLANKTLQPQSPSQSQSQSQSQLQPQQQLQQQPQSQQQPQQQQHPRVPVSVVLAFLVGYIGLGAVVFSAWEEWSYLDGAYFSFITLSTIGFGDLVPGSKVLEQGQAKLVACIVYLVVGLAMIAMSFNLVQEEVITHFQRLGQNMGILDEK